LTALLIFALSLAPQPAAPAADAEALPATRIQARPAANGADPDAMVNAPDGRLVPEDALSMAEREALCPAAYRALGVGAMQLRLLMEIRKILFIERLRPGRIETPPVNEPVRVELDPAWKPLLERLAKDGFDPAELEALFARMGPESYSPAFMAAKITELYGVIGVGINRDKAPTPQAPPGYVQPVPDVTIGSCLAFMKEHEKTFEDIQRQHGVPRQVVLAILLIETSFGLNLGKEIALRALASMAATGTPEALAANGNKGQVARISASRLVSTLKDKSDWAYKELKALLRYGKDNNFDLTVLPGSVYGAIGLCQFMPSNLATYGVDGDKDGSVNLFSVADAMYSAARYLEDNGWRGARGDAARRRVIMTYNHDGYYASSVLDTSKLLLRALSGKVSATRLAISGGGGLYNRYARLDPSLRRMGPPPRKARVQPLGNYKDLLK
jgi:membrane-bound lytic murein transglycosylase B